MDARTAEQLNEILAPPNQLSVLDWCEREVWFPADYQTDYSRGGRYRIDLFPWCREPLEALLDPVVREIIYLKCSQSGVSQNLLISALLYWLVNRPSPVLFYSAQQENSEAFYLKRIRPFFQSSPALRKIFAGAYERGMEINFANGASLAVSFAGSKSGVKQNPGALVLADEIDIYGAEVMEKLRQRLTHYHNSKLVAISAPDERAKIQKHKADEPTTPIFSEFAATDQRHFYLPDPITGNWFRLRFGQRDNEGNLPPDGIKWAADAKDSKGRWNLRAVEESAYYVTPDGTRITDDDKRRLINLGRWQPHNPQALPSRRGYHINQLYLPSKTWGEIATSFLIETAKGSKQTRTWILERLAEKCWDEKRGWEKSGVSILASLEAAYKRGEVWFNAPAFADQTKEEKHKLVMLTADVQMREIFWMVTGWLANGDCGIIDWGRCFGCSQLWQVAQKYGATKGFIDANYDTRSKEVYEACYKFGFVGCVGRTAAKLYGAPWTSSNLNVFEGTKRKSSKSTIKILDWATDTFKEELMDRMTKKIRKQLYVYSDPDGELAAQLTSEELIDREWVPHGPNHLWDCAACACMGAAYLGYNRTLDSLIIQPPEQPAEIQK